MFSDKRVGVSMKVHQSAMNQTAAVSVYKSYMILFLYGHASCPIILPERKVFILKMMLISNNVTNGEKCAKRKTLIGEKHLSTVIIFNVLFLM